MNKLQEHIETLWLRPWTHPATGQVRYYLDEEALAVLADLHIERYKSGNISSAVIAKMIQNKVINTALEKTELLWMSR